MTPDAMDGTGPERLWWEAGGDGEPALLLLHGLGATGDVWRPFAAEAAARWPGRVILVDLPGHGRSGRLAGYSYEAHADAVQPLLGGGRAVVVGHSMGGVVGLVLAGRAAAGVAAVVGVGIKSRWTEDDAAGMRHLAARPARSFDTRDEAAARYLRSVGLDGLVSPDDPMVASGLVAEDGRWRLALDQAAFGVGVPDLAGYLAAAGCPVTLARGREDTLVSLADLAALHPSPRELPGLGHNAHVEGPAAVWRFVEAELAANGAPPG
jgi:pimeloyl-ACP methyl ester carboxylesterase